MMSAHLQKAIDNLHIVDVYLRYQFCECSEGFDPKYAQNLEQLTVQQLHQVRHSEVVAVDHLGQILRVFIRLGARWIRPEVKDEELSVMALIEAEFIAEYKMSELIDQCSIDEFCLKNVSYHVWPYWRELLSNQCSRMHLPRLMLPAIQLAHNRHASLPIANDSEAG